MREQAKNLIMLDDGCGFGDMVACCPTCKKPFSVPIGYIGIYYRCRYCNQLCKLPRRKFSFEDKKS